MEVLSFSTIFPYLTSVATYAITLTYPNTRGAARGRVIGTNYYFAVQDGTNVRYLVFNGATITLVGTISTGTWGLKQTEKQDTRALMIGDSGVYAYITLYDPALGRRTFRTANSGANWAQYITIDDLLVIPGSSLWDPTNKYCMDGDALEVYTWDDTTDTFTSVYTVSLAAGWGGLPLSVLQTGKVLLSALKSTGLTRIQEDFESLTIGTLDGQGSWVSRLGNPGSCVAGQMGQFTAAKASKWTIPVGWDPLGWNWIQFKYKVSGVCRFPMWVFSGAMGALANVSTREAGGGSDFEIFDGAVSYNLFVYQTATWYYIRWWFNSNTNKQFVEFSKDGFNWKTYDNGGAYYNMGVADPVWISFEMHATYSSTGNIDDIAVSWLGGDEFENDGQLLYGPGSVDDDNFILVNIFHEATEKQNHADFTVEPDVAPVFTPGTRVLFNDGFDRLAFDGFVLVPKNTSARSRYRFQAGGFARSFMSKYKALFTAQTTKQILQTVIGALTYVFDDSSIDPSGDFTTTYTRTFQVPIGQILKFARELERAVVYMEPGGKFHARKYDDLIETGIRWDQDHPQVKLVEFYPSDMLITRSIVTGAVYKTATGNAQVKRTYIGDAELEASLEPVPIELNDNQMLNDTECLQMATNRFKIYSNWDDVGAARQMLYFVKIRVANHGFLQPGQLIEFGWEDATVSIPRGPFLILGHDTLELKTSVSNMWITNAIVGYDEFVAVQKTIGRDDELVGTFYEGSAADSTGAGTPVKQNSVNQLRAGTYVGRRPEAATWDYFATTLPSGNVPSLGVSGWRTVPFSTIVPAGARAIHFFVEFSDNPAGHYFWVREPGLTGAFQLTGGYVHSNNTTLYADLTCACNENRDLDVYFDQAPNLFTYWRLTVLGWWI